LSRLSRDPGALAAASVPGRLTQQDGQTDVRPRANAGSGSTRYSQPHARKGRRGRVHLRSMQVRPEPLQAPSAAALAKQWSGRVPTSGTRCDRRRSAPPSDDRARSFVFSPATRGIAKVVE
jgi:hypothetical protein